MLGLLLDRGKMIAMGIIDNRNSNTLSAALSDALQTAKSLDIFTGYFFFSGFAELANQIKDINVRVIVGMDIDPKVIAAKRITDDSDLSRHQLADEPPTITAKIKNYQDSFIALFNNTDLFDKERIAGAFDIFFSKIKDGTLEVRMNSSIDHSKYYLVHNKDEMSQNGANPGTRFMGSSNFTISGLKGQGELNDRRIDPEDFKDYQRRFESDWGQTESIPVLDKYSAEDFLQKVKKQTSLFEDPSPYLVYVRILKELFEKPDNSTIKKPGALTNGIYTDFQYQLDAIIDGIDVLDKYNGVIVADVVGLGKSIVASGIAANLGHRVIVITPPHLEQQWKDYAYEFGLTARIYTTGKIEKALEENDFNTIQTVIVDEAHRFRNEDTLDYQNLHKLCLGNKVILLTATPFNNDPKDLFALIRLFDAPSQSRINTVENLSIEFRLLISEYQKMRRQLKKMDDREIKNKAQEIALKMRDMAGPVIIRRSRVDLDKINRYRIDLQSQGINFPKVNNPILLEYDLGNLGNLYLDTLERITNKDNGFTAARYQPLNFVKDMDKFKDLMQNYYNDIDDFKQAQTNLANFMRRFLVLRFESSVASFDKTLGNFIKGHKIIIDWYEKFGFVPIYKKGSIPDPEDLENAFDIAEISEEFSEDVLESALNSPELSKDVEKGLMLIPANIMTSGFLQSLKRDVELLKSLKDQWAQTTKNLSIDPKVEDVKRQIADLLNSDGDRKIIIFTAYTDTADYLEEKLLADDLRVLKYTGSIASARNKEIVKKNFDAGLPQDKQDNDFDVLIATDAISEGYNLHRAGVIINYDIPYNPVRVVQRVGRINRINKKMFDELFIYNCFPTIIGESEVATKRISSLKIHLMNELLGTDVKVLTDEETIQTFFIDTFKEENAKNNDESWDTEFINYWDSIRFDKQLIAQASDIKQRSFLARKIDNSGIVLFGKRGKGLPVFVTDINRDLAMRVPAQEVLHIIQADQGEEPVQRSNQFKKKYQSAVDKLFKQDKLPDNKGRRGDAINVLDALKETYPPSKNHCEDVKKIIKDLDGFPEGTLKRIVDLQKMYFKKSEFEDAYNELRDIASVDYMAALQERVQGRLNEPETLLIAEEIL
jgi:superfamily II DNA or RNA helicase